MIYLENLSWQIGIATIYLMTFEYAAFQFFSKFSSIGRGISMTEIKSVLEILCFQPLQETFTISHEGPKRSDILIIYRSNWKFDVADETPNFVMIFGKWI